MNIISYATGAVFGQYLSYWAVPKCLFNCLKIASKSITPLLQGGELCAKITKKLFLFLLYQDFFSVFLDYSEILLKEHFQLLNYRFLFLLSVASTEAGHRREYLVNVGACCAYCSITKSVLHELGGLVCFQVLACDNLIQVVLLTLLFICLPLEQKIGISMLCHRHYLLYSQCGDCRLLSECGAGVEKILLWYIKIESSA